MGYKGAGVVWQEFFSALVVRDSNRARTTTHLLSSRQRSEAKGKRRKRDQRQ
jgi:hypothetical protein